MITVTELNEKIKAILEATFEHIIVEGEVASATYHSSGHLYFSIKDDKSSIKCVMWRSNVNKLKFKLEPGEHIIVDASLGVYAPRGEYQLIAVKIEPFGKGALSVAFEQLKAKLEAKGYFKDENKKPIPRFPKKIAIVTALGGAALQDMLKIAKRRWRLAEFIVIDVLVQGENASKEISKAIKYADNLACDVIVVSRGGGSQEDLWAFNEEMVADAIFNAKTPIVSAIGHEVDFLISDFVADLRAPTPSAAMEMILPDSNEYLMFLDELSQKLSFNINTLLYNKEQELQTIIKQLKLLSPIDRLNLIQKEFATLKERLESAIDYKFKVYQSELLPIPNRLNNLIETLLSNKSTHLKMIKEQLKSAIEQKKIQDGFAEIIKDGKRVSLCELKSSDKIELVNQDCKLKATID